MYSATTAYEVKGLEWELHNKARCQKHFTLHFALLTLHLKWWVATVLPRVLRFKRPLHRLQCL